MLQLQDTFAGVPQDSVLGPTNFRCFTISKMMENVINSAIKQHLLSNNLLSNTQFGFCQGHSAPDPITALIQTWTKELNSRGE
eukprot:g30266.t1